MSPEQDLPPLADLWTVVNQLRKALKVPPLCNLDKPWDVQVDSEFRFFINGSNRPSEYNSPMGSGLTQLPPYNAHVFFGEWLAGTFGPMTGHFVYHPNCNAVKFVKAINKKVEEVLAQ